MRWAVDRERRRPRRPRWSTAIYDGVRFVPRWNDRGLAGGFVDGCPPGLDKKDNGCMPPGQAKKLVGTPLSARLAQRARLDRTANGIATTTIICIVGTTIISTVSDRDSGLIDAIFPYQKRDYYYYPVGMSIRSTTTTTTCLTSISPTIRTAANNRYRYGDGAIYRVNPASGLIQGIAALLTGDPLGVGQPLPPGYSAYNVPFAYRERYYDTADNMVSLQRWLHLSGRSDDPADHSGDQRHRLTTTNWRLAMALGAAQRRTLSRER